MPAEEADLMEWGAENCVTVTDQWKITVVVRNKNVLRTNRINIQIQSKTEIQSAPFGVSRARHMLDKLKMSMTLIKLLAKSSESSSMCTLKSPNTTSLDSFRVYDKQLLNSFKNVLFGPGGRYTTAQ